VYSGRRPAMCMARLFARGAAAWWG
jgi:hypothetical protein